MTPGNSPPSDTTKWQARLTVRAAFALLGLPTSANREEVRKAYRRLAFECHPDRHGGSTESLARFPRLTQAYHLIEHKFKVDAQSQPFPTKPGECDNCGTYARLQQSLDGHLVCHACVLASKGRSLPSPPTVVVTCTLAIVSLVVAIASLLGCLATGSPLFMLVGLLSSMTTVVSLAVTCLVHPDVA